MQFAVTGSHGLVGSDLVPSLAAEGHRVIRLVRGAPASDSEVAWDPAAGISDLPKLEGIDALVHLAGESIAAGRWTRARKAEIRRSRVEGTQHLCESIARLTHPPKVMVSASAMGFYGDRGEEQLDETSAPGTGFLAEVCRAWESATEPAAQAGVGVIKLRFGLILSAKGGALKKMLPPFEVGAGGKIGSGRQFMSWIAIDDVVAAIRHAIGTPSLAGPVNAVSPSPVTNADFTRILARTLSRPAVMPLPAFAARLMLGEMADALLLASARIVPRRLIESGFRFSYPELEGALRHVLGK